MSQEIIYTSAQKGLRSGSFGFCTVCSTGGMEPNMADFLEGISAYPHPYKPPDPRTNQNPVNYSHIIWTIGGQRFHILSRVCDAGLDYTGRTNLLAHHVALTRREAESAAGGPAWVLSDDDFTVSKWDGQLRTLPGRLPRKDDIPLEVCRHWQQASGDAGHAGVLAEAYLDKSGRPVTVIYKPETDVLALVREALSLLPVEKRWNVTFSTFYTKIYSSFECQWRFIFAGSPDAAAARKNPHSLVIDLAGPTTPKRAAGGSLVEAARTGQFVIRTAAAPVAPSSGVYVPGRTRPPSLAAIPPPNPLGEQELRVLPPEMVPAAGAEPETLHPNPFVSPKRGGKHWIVSGTIGILAGVCVALAAILGFVIFNDLGSQPVVSNPELPLKQSTKQAVTIDRKPPPLTVTPSIDRKAININVAPSKASDPLPKDPAPPVHDIEKAVEKPLEAPPPPEELSPPFSDIEKRNHVLKVPILRRTGGVITTPQPLCNIFVTSPKECDITLEGLSVAFHTNEANLIMQEVVDKIDTREWVIKRKPLGAASGGPAVIATFALRDKVLTFRWSKTALEAPKPDALRFCRLRLKVADQSTTCRLSEPEELEPIALSKPVIIYNLKQILDLSSLSAIDNLRLEVQPSNFPATVRIQPAEAIPPGRQQELFLFEGTEEEGILILFDLQFSVERSEDGLRQIHIKCGHAYMTRDQEFDDAFVVARGSALNMKTLKDRKAEYALSAGVFSRKAKETEINLQKQDNTLKPIFDKLNVAIENRRRDKDEAGLKARQEEKDVFQAQLDRVVAAKVESKLKLEAHQAKMSHLDRLIELTGKIQAESRLEFRIFMLADKDEVDLYRSKGFTSKRLE